MIDIGLNRYFLWNCTLVRTRGGFHGGLLIPPMWGFEGIRNGQVYYATFDMTELRQPVNIREALLYSMERQ